MESSQPSKSSNPGFDALPKIKLSALIKHFRSKKVKGIKEFRPLSMLDYDKDEDEDQATIMMTSFARSGNTLSRGYLERITSIATGSDSNPDFKLNKDL